MGGAADYVIQKQNKSNPSWRLEQAKLESRVSSLQPQASCASLFRFASSADMMGAGIGKLWELARRR